jgi:hypothetical protein
MTARRFRLGFTCACALAATTAGATRATAATTAYRNAVLADGATAYYEFDTTTPTDSAGSDNNAAIQGTVTTGVPSASAVLGSAYSFGGAGSVRIPDAASFDLGGGPVTVELWYRTSAAARGDLFTYKGAGGDFGIHSNSQAAPGFTGSASTYNSGFVTTSAAGADLNQWHHYVITRDAAGNWSAYTDGVLRSNGTNTSSLNIANDLLIGANHGGDPGVFTNLPFTGEIDEVAWYPISLSQAVVQNHYALAAVPEPASVATVGLLAALGVLRRRRGTLK